MDENKFDYDVIFSLAGEQATYVGEVAKYLIDHEIKVWFYKFHKVELWGKNQIDYYSQIFMKSAKYCVVFISKEYVEKIWPNLERQFIQSRWLKDPEYLLPARFDESLIIGIPDTISYISLKNLAPEEFGKLIAQKVIHSVGKTPNPIPPIRKPIVKQSFNPFDIRNDWISSICSEINKRSKEVTDMKIEHDEIESTNILRVRFREEVIYSLNLYKWAHMRGDDGISFYGVEGQARLPGNASNAFGTFGWNKTKNCVALKLFDMSLFDILPGTEREFSKDEFIDTLWDKICNIIEKKY